MNHLRAYEEMYSSGLLDNPEYPSPEEVEDYLIKWIDRGELDVSHIESQEVLHSIWEATSCYPIYIQNSVIDKSMIAEIGSTGILGSMIRKCKSIVYLRTGLPTYGYNKRSIDIAEYSRLILQDYFEKFVTKCGYTVNIFIGDLDNPVFHVFPPPAGYNYFSKPIVKIEFISKQS